MYLKNSAVQSGCIAWFRLVELWSSVSMCSTCLWRILHESRFTSNTETHILANIQAGSGLLVCTKRVGWQRRGLQRFGQKDTGIGWICSTKPNARAGQCKMIIQVTGQNSFLKT